MDNIVAKVLQMAAPAVAPSLTEIFNMSIDTQQFFSEWKTAKVIPFLVQSFFETLQYCDEWRKFTSVSQSVSESVIV